jgi:hypothetical protein
MFSTNSSDFALLGAMLLVRLTGQEQAVDSQMLAESLGKL